MKLSHRGEYALLALLYLGRAGADELVSIQSIATAQKIPKKYLEQILLTLKRGGYVASARGKDGGYRLARSPTKITIAEVVRLFEGALAPTASVSRYYYNKSPIEQERSLVRLFREIRNLVSKKLESTTLADLV